MILLPGSYKWVNPSAGVIRSFVEVAVAYRSAAIGCLEIDSAAIVSKMMDAPCTCEEDFMENALKFMDEQELVSERITR